MYKYVLYNPAKVILEFFVTLTLKRTHFENLIHLSFLFLCLKPYLYVKSMNKVKRKSNPDLFGIDSKKIWVSTIIKWVKFQSIFNSSD